MIFLRSNPNTQPISVCDISKERKQISAQIYNSLFLSRGYTLKVIIEWIYCIVTFFAHCIISWSAISLVKILEDENSRFMLKLVRKQTKQRLGVKNSTTKKSKLKGFHSQPDDHQVFIQTVLVMSMVFWTSSWPISIAKYLKSICTKIGDEWWCTVPWFLYLCIPVKYRYLCILSLAINNVSGLHLVNTKVCYSE